MHEKKMKKNMSLALLFLYLQNGGSWGGFNKPSKVPQHLIENVSSGQIGFIESTP
jgi:hypothetical protein